MVCYVLFVCLLFGCWAVVFGVLTGWSWFVLLFGVWGYFCLLEFELFGLGMFGGFVYCVGLWFCCLLFCLLGACLCIVCLFGLFLGGWFGFIVLIYAYVLVVFDGGCVIVGLVMFVCCVSFVNSLVFSWICCFVLVMVICYSCFLLFVRCFVLLFIMFVVWERTNLGC